MTDDIAKSLAKGKKRKEEKVEWNPSSLSEEGKKWTSKEVKSIAKEGITDTQGGGEVRFKLSENPEDPARRRMLFNSLKVRLRDPNVIAQVAAEKSVEFHQLDQLVELALGMRMRRKGHLKRRLNLGYEEPEKDAHLSEKIIHCIRDTLYLTAKRYEATKHLAYEQWSLYSDLYDGINKLAADPKNPSILDDLADILERTDEVETAEEEDKQAIADSLGGGAAGMFESMGRQPPGRIEAAADEEPMWKTRGTGKPEIEDIPHASWGQMETVEPARDKVFNPVGEAKYARRGKYGRLVHPHKAWMPARLGKMPRMFERKLPVYGCSILFDVSGSMGFEPEDVVRVIHRVHEATIAMYSGTGSRGLLVVLAKRRTRVGDRLHLVIANSMHGGNVVDGPALRWLATQPPPRIWVSDGHVTGLGDYTSRANLVECAWICKLAGITRIDRDVYERMVGLR